MRPDPVEGVEGAKSTAPSIVFAYDGQPGTMSAGRTEEHDTRLDLLYKVGRKTSSVPELSNLIDQITLMTEQTLKASASSVLLLDQEKQEFFFYFADGPVAGQLKQVKLSAGSGIAGWVVLHGEPLIVNNVTEDERFCKDVDEITGFDTRSIMCAPLVVCGNVLGVIEVLNKLDGSDFNEQDLESLVAVASTAAMVVELKHAEEALRASEEHYSALVASLTDAVFKIKDGVVTWCNERVEEVYGYPKDELIAKDASSLFPSEISLSELTREISTVTEERDHFCGTTKFRKKDGSLVDIEYCISDIQGKYPVELVAVARDVTKRKQAEEERRRLEEQLQIAGRLAVVGKLAAGIAHEMSNPLAAVQGFAQFLAQRDDLDEQTKLDVQTIYGEAQRAAKVVSSLLSLAYRHKPEKSSTSINGVLEKSLEIHAHTMQVNNIDVVTELDPDLPRTLADFHQMQQVFLNIITNAEQAMTEAHGKGKLLVKTKKTGEMIQITFSDDGPGISGENLGRIFDPFFTTKDIEKGAGLGLSICFGIVRDHDGRLYAKSEPGEGATLVVEIPIDPESRPFAEQPDLIDSAAGS
jgi:two-component system NtrC family sensor kinase